MTIVTVVALAAALGCPAHMLWRLRQGRHSGCIPAPTEDHALHERQVRLAANLALVSASQD